MTPKLIKEIQEQMGKELRGKFNETIMMILLIKNYEAAIASQSTTTRGFRGRRDRNLVTEGLTSKVIADELQMPQSTVSTAIKRVRDKGWITHSKGMPVKITDEGKNTAYEKLKHHRLLEVYLVDSLGMTVEQAHDEASKLMLIASCELVNQIQLRYNNPETCPCGEKIPESKICKRTFD
ncbi:MAG: metal-dependent transcriptional regulator [Candidatus Heimdallarchaeota archaeon]|nr:metal-dependent transcriptional regulator [Candidatus Heimdallarchaeota archaeon]